LNEGGDIPEIVTPSNIVKKLVDLISKQYFNSETKFLDMACKGGEFLKEIYDRLMADDTIPGYLDNSYKKSNHILGKQLFGLTITDNSKVRATSVLEGFGYNIKRPEDYEEVLKSVGKNTKPYNNHKNIRDIVNKAFNSNGDFDIILENKEKDHNMHFNVIIGNPPYQEDNGGGQGSGANSLYDKFILSCGNSCSRGKLHYRRSTKNV